MKYLFPLLVFLGGCGGCKGDDASTPDAGDDDVPDAATAGDPTTGAWRDGFGLPGPNGFGSRVEDVAVSTTGDVYAAGIFSDAAGVPANNVAVWDGTDWAPLGPGIDGWVRAIALDAAGDLWAAVTTDEADGGSVRRWDGAAWTTVGSAAGGGVYDLTVIPGGVAVVGAFSSIDGVNAASVATYDGTWHAVGDGTISGEATAVAADTVGFCVAGSFDTIGGVAAENAACWTGVVWAPLGAALQGGVAVLAKSPGGTWYAGGTLTYTVDPDTGAYEAGIAVLNGATWEPFEGGIDGGFINEVRAIAFDGDDVLVGGHFQSAGDTDVPARHAARWSPTGGWAQLGDGLINDVGVFLPSIVGAHDIVVATDGTYWVGGLFTRAGEATPAVNVAHLSESETASALVGTHPVLGVGGFVDDLAVDEDGDILAGGGFAFAGTTVTAGFAGFDGDGWTDLGNGLQGIVRDVIVRRDGTIAVAGELVYEDEPVAFAQVTSTGWALTGGAVHGTGFALAEEDDGVLWLGGDLFDVDGNELRNIARLEGTAWSNAGSFDGRVSALVIHDGAVVAAGSFTGGVSIRDGSTWSVLGGGLDGEIAYANALTSSPSLGLVVGGSFDGAGGATAPNLVRWDGSQWTDVGGGVDGLGGYGFASALLAYGDGLFVAGGFDTAGGTVTVSNLAWYDGSAWHDLGGGLADLAESMVVANDVLYLGGPFTVAGGRPSSGFAAWDFSPAD